MFLGKAESLDRQEDNGEATGQADRGVAIGLVVDYEEAIGLEDAHEVATHLGAARAVAIDLAVDYAEAIGWGVDCAEDDDLEVDRLEAID